MYYVEVIGKKERTFHPLKHKNNVLVSGVIRTNDDRERSRMMHFIRRPKSRRIQMKLQKHIAGMFVTMAFFTALTMVGYAKKVQVTGIFVNVQHEPSTENKLKGLVLKDQILDVLETQEDWHKIQYGDDMGYVHSKFLKEISAPTNQEEKAHQLKVLVETLNVREKPSVEAEILGEINKGEDYELLEANGEWIRLKASNVEGWVYAQYVNPVEPLKNNVTTIAEKVNLRSGPSTEFEVLGTAQKDMKYTYVSNKNGWVQVKDANGEMYWILAQLVKVDGVVIPKPRKLISTSRGGTVVERGSDKRQRVASYSKEFTGTPYVWGGSTPNGFDCSGLTQYVYRQFGVTLNRVAVDQAKQGRWVSKNDLSVGDLVFFDTDGTGSYINHVGIYLGNGQFIAASGDQYRGGRVRVDNLNTGFYANTYLTARTFF